MTAASDVLRSSPETLPTIVELGAAVKAGRMNKYQAAHMAMARRDAGLCDYCSNKADVDESAACSKCREEM